MKLTKMNDTFKKEFFGSLGYVEFIKKNPYKEGVRYKIRRERERLTDLLKLGFISIVKYEEMMKNKIELITSSVKV
jgi:hypothetical protein